MLQTGRSAEWHLTEAVILDDLARVQELVTTHGLPSDGYALLLDAVKLNHTAIIKYLLKKGAKVNSVESDRDTPLHFAVASGELEIVRMLLDSNAAVDASNVEKETPLHAAVEKNDEGIVRLLLYKGARSLPDKSNFEPLHLACARQSASTVELLLIARAQSKSVDRQSLDIALLLAAQSGNQQIVSLLLNAGADPNIFVNSTLSHHRLPYSVSDGSSPLHLACKGGYLDIVKLFLERKGELINCVQSRNNFTPLHLACENGHLDVVRYLLSKHADPNIDAKDGSTPLHLAAQGGHLKVADLLCKNGANLEALTSEDVTPLLLAVKHGREDVVRMLLYRGACVNAKDKRRNSSLYFAVENGGSSLIKCILQFEPKIDVKVSSRILDILNESFNPAVDDLIVYCVTTKHKDVSDFALDDAVWNGYRKTVEILLALGVEPDPSLLHLAVQRGDYEIIQSFLKSGFVVNSNDSEGKTPIHHLFHNDRRNYDIFQLLLSFGADYKEVSEPLHGAAICRCIESCKWWIGNGADVNERDEYGFTPLQNASVGDTYGTMRYCEDYEDDDVMRGGIARLLLSNGANAIVDEDLSTILHHAAFDGDLVVVQASLEFKVDINAKNKHLCTPLHRAAVRGHEDIVEILLKNGAEVDALRQNAVTPLHLCAQYGYAGVMKLLLQFHADISAQDVKGNTALHCALKRNVDGSVKYFDQKYHKAITVLLDNGCDVNIENHAGKTAMEFINSENIISIKDKDKVIDAVVSHILKLKAAGLFINDKNKQLLNEVWLSSNDDVANEFEEDCKEEVERMKQLKLCCHSSVHDVLVNSSYLASITNESVICSWAVVDLNKFPIYRSLIRSKFKKNEEINASKNWLNVLIKTRSVLYQERALNLPAEVLLEIVSYLKKKDLRCLIECGKALKRQLC